MTNKQTTRSAASKTVAKKTDAPEGNREPALVVPDYSVLVGAQMESVKVVSGISKLMMRTAQELASKQAAYMMANAEALQSAAASSAGETTPSTRLARQSELYRDIMERSADHASVVTETVSGCCCEAVDQIAEAATALVQKTAQLGAAESPKK